MDLGQPPGLSGLQVGNAWVYRPRCSDGEVPVLRERVGGAGGVGGAKRLASRSHTELLDSNVRDTLPVECSVDGGLDVLCRPPNGFLIVGGLPVVGEGVACVFDELKAPEFHG